MACLWTIRSFYTWRIPTYTILLDSSTTINKEIRTRNILDEYGETMPFEGCLTDFDKFIEGGRLTWTWFEELFNVLPPVNSISMYTVKYNWIQETFNKLPPNANKETMRRYASADKYWSRRHIRWLPYVARLDHLDRYLWESAALAWLYRCMCWVSNRIVVRLASPYATTTVIDLLTVSYF
ncbi:hypothetical protein Ahy_A04g019571 [Arachis hypogaea]|uniref:Aminotransferase-like plant mobile domain-containing protein n=1 Tax=Arachis hypogaea TaxID=3818 RepID=A0A445DG56_ARAHY|nr:hypothetical protein Ahy_A04g019571 [Arachis hypogaea]